MALDLTLCARRGRISSTWNKTAKEVMAATVRISPDISDENFPRNLRKFKYMEKGYVFRYVYTLPERRVHLYHAATMQHEMFSMRPAASLRRAIVSPARTLWIALAGTWPKFMTWEVKRTFPPTLR